MTAISTAATNNAIYNKLTSDERKEAIQFQLSNSLLANYEMYLECLAESRNSASAAWKLFKGRAATQRLRLMQRVISIGKELDRVAAQAAANTADPAEPAVETVPGGASLAIA